MEDIQRDQWCQNNNNSNGNSLLKKSMVSNTQLKSPSNESHFELDPENDNLNIIKFVAKFAAKAEKKDGNRAKSAFKQPPVIINTQPIKSIEKCESFV